MLHSPYSSSVQKVAYKYISGPKNNNNNNNNNDSNNDNANNANYYDNEPVDYVENQSDIVNLQNQKKIGTIPDYINKYPHDNIIGNLRYGSVNQPETLIKPPEDKYHTYDPYNDYLYKMGLLNNNSRTRINTKTYAIDSSARMMKPQIVTKKRTILEPNAINYDTITENIGVNTTTKYLMSIYCPNHGITKGENITLSGVSTNPISIKSIYTDINGELKNAIIFTNYSVSVVFKCNFDTYVKDPNTGLFTSKLDSSMSFDPNFKIGNGISYDELKKYDTSDMFVTISGFDISSTGMPFVGNIPMNFLNSTHRIYFTNPDYKIINGINVYSPDTLINVPDQNNVISKITGFYIKLQVPFIGTIDRIKENNYEINTGSPMIINLDFNYIGGIPLNYINAHYPVDNDNAKGSHEVYSVTNNKINIIVNKPTYYKITSNNGLSESNVQFGGSELELTVLEKVLKGYSSQNNYTVELPNTIHNVVMAKLTSIVVANTAKVFTDIIGSKNNKIYWQNQDDGDFIYSVDITPGNYTPVDLQQEIQSKIYSVPRKYTKNTNQSTSYSDRIYMAVIINTNTNIVTFTAFKEAVLRKPIQDITPTIPNVGDGAGSYTLTISQNGHGLFVGDTVTFADLIATNGIPASVLNKSHIIRSVLNNDTYTIQIDNFNLATGSRIQTGGGFSARVLVPCAFRLLFNYPDTIGKELGFRKVGQTSSITKFNSTITNADAYEGEIVTIDTDGIQYVNDESGNKIVLASNSLKLDGHDFIMMVIRKFDNIVNISSKKNIGSYFAKINLRGLPGTVVYDDFVCPPLTFYEPIEISQLDVSFYNPNGELYEFNGIDHNFTIEITNIEYLPENTGIVSTLSMF